MIPFIVFYQVQQIEGLLILNINFLNFSLIGARTAQAIVDEALNAAKRIAKERLSGGGSVRIYYVKFKYERGEVAQHSNFPVS